MDQATADAIARVRGTTGTCWLCGTAVQQVPQRDEWAWADEVGGTMGVDADLRDNLKGPDGKMPENPYEALNWFGSQGLAHAGEYSMLLVRLSAGWHHQHQVAARPGRPPGAAGPLPDHCRWPMRLTPSGWACRQCDHRQEDAETEPGQLPEPARA